MNERKHLEYKRLFSIIKLIKYSLKSNPKKTESYFVEQTIKKEGEKNLKKQLFDYFGLNEEPKSVYLVTVYASNGIRKCNVWLQYIQNNREMAKWFGETVSQNISRATPEVGCEYTIEKMK